VEWRDGEGVWGTVGVSENIVEASWLALADAVEYKLFKDGETPKSSEKGAPK
jgi:2-isopropylmalate synthase